MSFCSVPLSILATVPHALILLNAILRYIKNGHLQDRKDNCSVLLGTMVTRYSTISNFGPRRSEQVANYRGKREE